MTNLSAAAARRLPRARWLDVRLLGGVLLILVAMVGGARVVSAADRTVPIWTVGRDLGAGTTLAPDDLVPRRVHLDGDARRYVSASAPPPAGRVLLRSVGAGELLPAGALATPGTAALRQVGVTVERLGGITRGAVVDVYRVPTAQPGRPPGRARSERLLREQATVAAVEDRGRALGSATRREVVLLVPSAAVRPMLDALVDARVELVQVPSTAAAR